MVFAIEKGGKSIFYCNDTSELCDESMECLRGFTMEKLRYDELNQNKNGNMG